MNYFKEITPLVGVQGTQVVAGAVTGGTIDFGPTYEPQFAAMLSMGAAVAALTNVTAYVHTSNDGSTWGTLSGSLVSASGTLATSTILYGSLEANARYLRGRLEWNGAGGTAVAGLNFLTKRRTVD